MPTPISQKLLWYNKKMKTWKEAIIKVLSENRIIMKYMEVYDKIDENNYYDWGGSLTPWDTVNAQLGSFIRNNDNRVKRIKKDRNFYYYLSKYENELDLEKFIEEEKGQLVGDNKSVENYLERDLHKIFVSYLKNENIFSKTIFHEENSRSDSNQKWANPDIIGVEFINLKNDISKELLKSVDKNSLFNMYSYEMKREIKNDYQLKSSFFQTVSNSSWANYGYLVALEINDNLYDEMERLNKSFGIGIIKLSSKPFESKILFPAKYKELEFETIDKLVGMNDDFKKFIQYLKNIINVDSENLNAVKFKFEKDSCDKYFDTNSDEEIKKYCIEKNIPFEKDEEN